VAVSTARMHRALVALVVAAVAVTVLVGTLFVAAPPAAADHPKTKMSAVASAVVYIKRGMRGATVAKIQRRVSVRPVDGIFGRGTERAVKRFQRRRGLEADGIVGPVTARAMGITLPRKPSSGTNRGTAWEQATLRKIAQCESGGNPRAVSASGQYRGKYQFDQSTWEANGGTGDPAAAPEAEQDRVAASLYAARGPAPWPVCGYR
jgi:resuscitation-promoting factor RpfB